MNNTAPATTRPAVLNIFFVIRTLRIKSTEIYPYRSARKTTRPTAIRRRIARRECAEHTLSNAADIPTRGCAEMSDLHSRLGRQGRRALALAGIIFAACARGGDAPGGAGAQRTTDSEATAAIAARDTSCLVGESEVLALADTGLYRVTQRLTARQLVDCRIHDGWPLTRIVIEADTADPRITGLRVSLPPVPGRADSIQQLASSADDPPPRGMPYFYASDLDGDGYRDLVAMAWWGATGNTGYDVWRWDPAARRFAKDSVLSGLSNPRPLPGRPCVTSHSVGGMAGMLHSSGVVCRERGRWVRESDESQDWNAAERFFVKVTRERHGDSLVVVRTDTVRDTL
jgi:hypothetical protein